MGTMKFERESSVYLGVFDCLAKFLNEKFAASGVEPKVVVPANINQSKLEVNTIALFTSPYNSFQETFRMFLTLTISLPPVRECQLLRASNCLEDIVGSHQRPPLPLFENHGGDDMPGGSALKRSPLGLNSRDLNQSGCSGDSIVEGERATTGLNSRALKKTMLLFFLMIFLGFML
ncbi:hypothetical protein DY000_02055193 [Brassica cretica]|uniref:Uncharacterized protein n=1 Tax=Brassica cretica TaxID=69181 RepID=A0ABQ7AIK7_BRACR|nr:hypothetical protein DY000_02055193 [Brassica cretica]